MTNRTSSDSHEVGLTYPALRKNVRLREEPQGAAIISDAEDSYGRYVLVSPMEAFILSLFDGTRTTRDVGAMLKALKNSPSDDAIQKDLHNFATFFDEFVEELPTPVVDPRVCVDPRRFLSKPDLLSPPARAHKPLWLDFYVTRKCNLKCTYCFANASYVKERTESDPPRAQRDRMWNLVDQIVDLGIRRILVTGGEPTLIPYLPDIIRALTDHGIRVVLATNAGIMTEKVARRLREAGLEHVQAKLDGSNPGTQDRLSGVPRSHAHLIEGIRILKKHDYRVSVASVVTAWNIREIPDVVRICADLGVDNFSARLYAPGIWALRGRGGQELNPSPSAISWLEREIPALQDRYRGAMDIESFDGAMFDKKPEESVPRCPAFISSCTILDNGLVVPCECLADFSDAFVIGDSNRHTLVEIWNSQRAEDWVLRKTPRVGDPCASCEEFPRCKGGCPWKSYVAYGSWSVDPSCVRAPEPSLIPFPVGA